MFASLPPELLRQIIESAIPLSFHSTTYNERQRTLSCLSLVSHRFREIAQPLVFERIWVCDRHELARIFAIIDSKGWTPSIRELVLSHRQRWSQGCELMGRVFELVNLRHLTISVTAGDVFDLSMVQLCSNLTKLHVYGDVRWPSSLAVLHSVHTVIVDSCGLKAFKTMLDPAVLPSLRVLEMVTTNSYADVKILSQSRVDSLVPQLESIFLSVHFVDIIPDYLAATFDHILFNYYSYCTPPNQLAPEIKNLRLMGFNRNSHEELLKELAFLAALERTPNPVSLRTLYLDASLEVSHVADRPVPPEIVNLVRICESKKVEIIYEDQPKSWEVDCPLSLEFCRRQRQRKMLEGTEL